VRTKAVATMPYLIGGSTTCWARLINNNLFTNVKHTPAYLNTVVSGLSKNGGPSVIKTSYF